MPTITSATNPTTADTRDEEFLDLVCADEQLLKAEFDAIIAQAWPMGPPPAGPQPAPRAVSPSPRPDPAPSGRQMSPPESHHCGDSGRGRQRSPPSLLPARLSETSRIARHERAERR